MAVYGSNLRGSIDTSAIPPMALRSQKAMSLRHFHGLEAKFSTKEALNAKMILKHDDAKYASPLLETKQKTLPSRLLYSSGGADSKADDLKESPLRSWLFHYTSKDPKKRPHFWKFEDDFITLYLSETESLFYKQITLSSIKNVKLLKSGAKLKISLQDSYVIVYARSPDPKRCNKVLCRWHDALNYALNSYGKSKNEAKTKNSSSISDASRLFSDLQFVFDLEQGTMGSKHAIRSLITKNGGQISYIITKNTNFLVLSKDSLAGKRSSYKLKKATSLKIPVISEDFIRKCIQIGKVLDVQEAVNSLKAKENFSKGKVSIEKSVEKSLKQSQFKIDEVVRYKVNDSDSPDFPDEYQIAKFSFLANDKADHIVCVEAHVASPIVAEDGQKLFRVWVSSKIPGKKTSSFMYFVDSISDLCDCYEYQVKNHETKTVKRLLDVPDVVIDDIASDKLRMLLEEMKTSAGMLHPEIVRLVDTIWTDSLGVLSEHSIDPKSLTASKVRNAMIILLKIEESIKSGCPGISLTDELYRHMNMKGGELIDSMQKVAKQRELCQLLKDVVSMNENMWLSSDISSSAFRYSALRCSLSFIASGEKEYKLVEDLMPDQASSKLRYKIRNIYRVFRSSEDVGFRHDLKNKKLLFHSSSSMNFVSILSRGLLLPSKASAELGIPRSDPGKLGSGIYFTDSFEISSNFTSISKSRGSRLMLVNEVALGDVYETNQSKVSLCHPPGHFDSVKGINLDDQFPGNEYVVYNVNQQRMRYLIEFTLNDEAVKNHDCKPIELSAVKRLAEPPVTDAQDRFEPKVKDVEYGLIVGGRKSSVNLEEYHIRGKIIDLVSEVTIFQIYRSNCRTLLEGKYVFPLNEKAAVCGFEAFINEKHVIGEVKEKEQARREYKKAIAEGHGAYLMDEEEPNVFTVSLGNIPARARIVIKIRYVAELETADEPDSCVVFSLPESLTEWKKDSTLLGSSVKQSSTKSTNIASESNKSSLIVSIDMPFDILDISSPTHKIVFKKTATKACVKLEKSASLLEESLRLLIKVAEIHVPRIWIESNDDAGGDQVAMVTFFPEFDFDKCENFDCTVLIDMSNSMSGESCGFAKHISSSLVRLLPQNSRFNVITFGSHYYERFIMFERCTDEMKQQGMEFIKSSSANLGASDLLCVMKSLFLLVDGSLKSQRMHNVFLVSDGHLADEEKLLQTASQMSQKSCSQMRFFTFGIGKSPNSHLLQCLSTVTGGKYEHFLPTAKRSWKSQLNDQISFAKQPVLTDVKITWCNYESYEPDQSLFVYVPEKPMCVFSGARLTAYSFLPNCRKATLHAKILGEEFSTVVTASGLSEITGNTIHSLATKATFKEYEHGTLAQNDYANQVIQDKRKSFIIFLSIKHSVVCKFTSFIAVEKRKPTEDMSISTGPTIKELLEVAFTDIIPEISWQSSEMSIGDRISQILQLSKSMESSSVLRSRELTLNAVSLCETLSKAELLKKLLVSAACARLEINSTQLDPVQILREILVEFDSINFSAVNEISRSEDAAYSDALMELTRAFWSQYDSIQLTSIPKFYRPCVIAAFVLLHQTDPEVINDSRIMASFWDGIRAVVTDEQKDRDVYSCILNNVLTMKSQLQKTRVTRLCGKITGFSARLTSFEVAGLLSHTSPPAPPPIVERLKICSEKRSSKIDANELAMFRSRPNLLKRCGFARLASRKTADESLPPFPPSTLVKSTPLSPQTSVPKRPGSPDSTLTKLPILQACLPSPAPPPPPAAGPMAPAPPPPPPPAAGPMAPAPPPLPAAESMRSLNIPRPKMTSYVTANSKRRSPLPAPQSAAIGSMPSLNITRSKEMLSDFLEMGEHLPLPDPPPAAELMQDVNVPHSEETFCDVLEKSKPKPPPVPLTYCQIPRFREKAARASFAPQPKSARKFDVPMLFTPSAPLLDTDLPDDYEPQVLESTLEFDNLERHSKKEKKSVSKFKSKIAHNGLRITSSSLALPLKVMKCVDDLGDDDESENIVDAPNDGDEKNDYQFPLGAFSAPEQRQSLYQAPGSIFHGQGFAEKKKREVSEYRSINLMSAVPPPEHMTAPEMESEKSSSYVRASKWSEGPNPVFKKSVQSEGICFGGIHSNNDSTEETKYDILSNRSTAGYGHDQDLLYHRTADQDDAASDSKSEDSSSNSVDESTSDFSSDRSSSPRDRESSRSRGSHISVSLLCASASPNFLYDDDGVSDLVYYDDLACYEDVDCYKDLSDTKENRNIDFGSLNYAVLPPQEKLVKALLANELDYLLTQISDLGFLDIPEDISSIRHECSKTEWIIINQVRQAIEDAGGRSLGISCFKSTISMLLMSIILNLSKYFSKTKDDVDNADAKELIEELENLIKVSDRKHPAMYDRLELGSSWPAAAESIIVRIAAELD